MKKKRVIKELLPNIVRISHRHPEGSVEGDAYHLWLIGCGGPTSVYFTFRLIEPENGPKQFYSHLSSF